MKVVSFMPLSVPGESEIFFADARGRTVTRLKFECTDTTRSGACGLALLRMRRLHKIILSGEGICSRNKRSFKSHYKYQPEGQSCITLSRSGSSFFFFLRTFVMEVYFWEGQANQMVSHFSHLECGPESGSGFGAEFGPDSFFT